MESNHLYARYSASTDSAWRLRDDFGSNDGVLHGATLVSDPERGHALAFNGTTACVDIPRDLAQSRQLTLSAWVRLDTNRPNQHIATFGKDNLHLLELLATQKDGNLALRLTTGDRITEVIGPKAPVNRWFHLVATLGDAGMTLTIDNKPAGTVPHPCHPDDIRPTVGFLGRGLTAGYLNGRITDLAFYTTALSETEIAVLK